MSDLPIDVDPSTRAELERLRRELDQREQSLRALSEELDETNRGVISLYAELEEQTALLKEASELKSRFMSYMTHEFRTPLGAIRSMTRLLLDRLDGPLSDEQAKQIAFIQQAAIELTDIVSDLLDLARVDAGRVTIAPVWFDMVDLFSALRGMFRPILASESVSLVFEEPIDVRRVYTDDAKLSHILRNYISNALKFTQRGEVRISARRIDETVVFTVADTGIGIPAEHLGALFQDYVQVDSPLQRRFRGAGLGLALSRRFAEMLGGRVSVESEVGVGSRFSVILPIRDDTDEAPRAEDTA